MCFVVKYSMHDCPVAAMESLALHNFTLWILRRRICILFQFSSILNFVLRIDRNLLLFYYEDGCLARPIAAQLRRRRFDTL